MGKNKILWICLGLVVGSVLLSGGYSAFQLAQLVKGREVSHARRITRQQSELVSQLVEIESQRAVERLMRLASAEEHWRKSSSGSGASLEFLKSDFLLVSVLSLEKGGSWAPQWAVSSNQLKVGDPRQYLKSIMDRLPLGRADSRHTAWSPLAALNQQLYLAVVTPARLEDSLAPESSGRSVLLVGFLPLHYFSKVAEMFKGGDGEVLAVDDQGHALVYPREQYLGVLLDNHPVVMRALKSTVKADSGTFPNLDGRQVIASFQAVNGAGIRVVATTPEPQLATVMANYLARLGVGLVALALLAAGLLLFWLWPYIRRSELLSLAVLDMAAERSLKNRHVFSLFPALQVVHDRLAAKGDSRQELPATPPAKASPAVDVESRIEVICRGMAQALRGPLLAILGHSQLASSKSEDQGLKEHYQIIEREARAIKDVLEHLKKITGEDVLPITKVDFEQVLSGILSSQRRLLNQAGVHVSVNYRTSAMVMAESQALKRAFEQILTNAVEAMAQTSEKNLLIEGIEANGRVQISISDSGTGIPSDKLQKIFDPFYSTKEGDLSMGLGLTVAMGLIKNMKGEIQIQSNLNQGTTITVLLPMAGEAHKARTSAAVISPALPLLEDTFAGRTDFSFEAYPSRDEDRISETFLVENEDSLPPTPGQEQEEESWSVAESLDVEELLSEVSQEPMAAIDGELAEDEWLWPESAQEIKKELPVISESSVRIRRPKLKDEKWK